MRVRERTTGMEIIMVVVVVVVAEERCVLHSPPDRELGECVLTSPTSGPAGVVRSADSYMNKATPTASP